MKILPYSITIDSQFRYTFLSVSDTKTVRKLVLYDLISTEFNLFNLALVDQLEDGTLDDLSVSDNNDMVRIMATVIHTMHLFLEARPDATIFFSGSTPSRTRLYRLAISQNIALFDETFTVKGLLNGEPEQYRPNTPYEGFTVQINNSIHEN